MLEVTLEIKSHKVSPVHLIKKNTCLQKPLLGDRKINKNEHSI
jgi:hypothetical protein